MKVAAIYDIHGNLPALEAVLDDIQRLQVDEIIVGGDVVPGPMPHDTLARLLELKIPARFIMGNGDREVLAFMSEPYSGEVPRQYHDTMYHSARQLTAENAQLISSWPNTLRVSIPRLGSVLFCHATPRSDTEIFTKLTPDDRLKRAFDGVDANIVVCGHTHMQFDRMLGNIRVVNAGSVGMPYGIPGAYWLLLGSTVELRCTSYNLVSAAERIRSSDYPQAEVFAASSVLQPPSEQSMQNGLSKFEITN